MFLFAKIIQISVHGNETTEVEQVRNMFDIPNTNLMIIKYVILHLSQAYFIHNWLVDNHLVGEFEPCRLNPLVELINRILQNHDLSYLLEPHTVNDEYFALLENIKNVIERSLHNPNVNLYEYSY